MKTVENLRRLNPLYVITTMLGEERHYFQGITEKPIVDPKTGGIISLKVNVWIPTFKDATVYPSHSAAKRWLKMIGADGCELEKIGYLDKENMKVHRLNKYDDVEMPNNVYLDGVLAASVLSNEQSTEVVRCNTLMVGDMFKVSPFEMNFRKVTKIEELMHWRYDSDRALGKHPRSGTMAYGEQFVLKLKSNLCKVNT